MGGGGEGWGGRGGGGRGGGMGTAVTEYATNPCQWAHLS